MAIKGDYNGVRRELQTFLKSESPSYYFIEIMPVSR